MTLADNRPGFRLTGWHVLACFVVFFGITIAVDTLMIVRAYATYPGEVTTSPYEDGLAYDNTLDQQKAQSGLGWRMTAGLAGADTVRLTAADKAGAPLRGLKITARLERPATVQGARPIQFYEGAPGVYQAAAAPLSGVWDLKLSAFDARRRRFDAERRLIAP
jgi:nitrogen fixation protein FixH